MTGAPQDEPGDVRWSLVVPVQDAGRAKSRLAPPHPLTRPDLARAVARDTLEQVCRAVPPAWVTVVTSDPAATSFARGLGAAVVADPGQGLNAAVRAGLAAAAQAAPGRCALAVLLGDLPALQAHELVTALRACTAHPAAVVPDADGTGTVLLTSTAGTPEPQFGAGSAQRHARAAVRLDLDLPGLRRDVDTADDLAAALQLGVGPHTAAALAPLGWAPDGGSRSWPH